MSIPVIEETRRYERFKFMIGNREINDYHVGYLKKSISEKNLLPWNPIIVDENDCVIDGQHRLIAAQELFVPIYFVKCPGATIQDVATLNTDKTTWSTDQYLESYVTRGFPEYLRLKEFSDRYDIPTSVARRILSKNHKDIVRKFRQGLFVADDQEHAKKVAELRTVVLPYVGEAFASQLAFINALSFIAEKGFFRVDRMKEKLEKARKIIHFQRNRVSYIRTLEDIYNEGERTAVSFF